MLAVISQSTLWTLTLIFTACSGLMLGLAISQSRPPACVPNSTSLSSDDGFWSLLSQLLLQLLSLYSTVIPLLRDGTLPVRRIWFSAAVSVSAIMNILALVLYAFSWKGSELLGYISGVSALVAGVHLAGMIEGVMQLPKAKFESE
jgi:asparagine N-glycosylation enzyme membrane subunit Stt3